MPIVDSQIHLWENARMSPQHRQIPTYNVDDALKEMAEAGVDAAVIHPPSTLGEAPNVQAVEAVSFTVCEPSAVMLAPSSGTGRSRPPGPRRH